MEDAIKDLEELVYASCNKDKEL